eukprot:Tamp_17258.p1 GENE.Tamp_17258~~Tamp_17258.p1  ORF type:complete len:264 (-),score=42.50 Tamp_17258:255-1046(-)
MHYGRERDHAHPNPKRARAQAAEEALEQMDHERLAAESLAASHRAAAGERGVAGLEGPHTVDTKVLEDRLRFLAADEGAGLTKTAVAASHELAEGAVLGSLSHIDAQTNQPTMVDVQEKKVTARTATARTLMHMPSAVMRLIGDDGEMHSKKGPVFATAIIAGTMAAKSTHTLIPFCHPLMLESCKVLISVVKPSQVQIDCTVRVTGKTGVEMEALTGASVAALTVYDMCKAVSHDMVIGDTRLLEKSGGKSDYVSPDRVPKL